LLLLLHLRLPWLLPLWVPARLLLCPLLLLRLPTRCWSDLWRLRLSTPQLLLLLLLSGGPLQDLLLLLLLLLPLGHWLWLRLLLGWRLLLLLLLPAGASEPRACVLAGLVLLPGNRRPRRAAGLAVLLLLLRRPYP
jgi:hypothetical protein